MCCTDAAAQVTALVNATSEKLIVVRHIRHMEIQMCRMLKHQQADGSHTHQQTVIMDMKNLSMMPHRAAFSAFRETVCFVLNWFLEK